MKIGDRVKYLGTPGYYFFGYYVLYAGSPAQEVKAQVSRDPNPAYYCYTGLVSLEHLHEDR